MDEPELWQQQLAELWRATDLHPVVFREEWQREFAPLRVAPGRGHMLIIEPGYEEICAWIAEWIRVTFPDAAQRGAA